MAVVQRTGVGSNMWVLLWIETMKMSFKEHRTVGLLPAGTIFCNNLSLGHCPRMKSK